MDGHSRKGKKKSNEKKWERPSRMNELVQFDFYYNTTCGWLESSSLPRSLSPQVCEAKN